MADTDVVCWTCGSNIDEEALEATLNRLHEYHSAQAEEVGAIDSEVNELQDQKHEFDRQQQ